MVGVALHHGGCVQADDGALQRLGWSTQDYVLATNS